MRPTQWDRKARPPYTGRGATKQNPQGLPRQPAGNPRSDMGKLARQLGTRPRPERVRKTVSGAQNCIEIVSVRVDCGGHVGRLTALAVGHKVSPHLEPV
jgi:hypothetical protein